MRSALVDEPPRQLLLRVHEAAALLGIGRTKAYELIARGDLQVVHIDGAARIPLVSVHRYVNALVSHPTRRIRSAPRTRCTSQPPLPFIDRTKD